MSNFNQGSALESQPTHWRRQDDPAYADDPEFEAFADQLSDKLLSLTSVVSRLSTQVGLLGTKRETERVRERVKDIIEDGSKTFKEAGQDLKKIISWPDVGPAQKFRQSKLNQDFQASLREFQELQKGALEKERRAANASRAILDEHENQTGEAGAGGNYQLQQQEQVRLASQAEVDFQENLIVEREQEIRGIEQSVNELNALFNDVAVMINQQGEGLETLADNIDNTRHQMQNANTELIKAARYQKSARNRMCCLLLILATVLTIIILAVVLG